MCDVATHECVENPTVLKKGGCSCRAPGDAGDADGAWAALGLLAIGAIARRGKRRRVGA